MLETTSWAPATPPRSRRPASEGMMTPPSRAEGGGTPSSLALSDDVSLDEEDPVFQSARDKHREEAFLSAVINQLLVEARIEEARHVCGLLELPSAGGCETYSKSRSGCKSHTPPCARWMASLRCR